MGFLLSKFRKKTSTKEQLEEIQDKIVHIEEFGRNTQAWHKKVIGYLITYFSVLYLISALVVYFQYFTKPEYGDVISQMKLLAPFFVAPIVFIVTKKLLTWWYHRKLRKNEGVLETLKEKKKKILDDVMETETYKVAKEILEKFAPEQMAKTTVFLNTPSKSTDSPNRPIQTPSGSELRRRVTSGGNTSAPSSPAHAPALGVSNLEASRSSSSTSVASSTRAEVALARRPANAPGQQGFLQKRPPGPPLPRPVLPRERGYMDRMVEYLVGDGPHNRFALICKQCQSHNGMALKEEFEYIAYRCCYCFYWNPARKQRPTAPRLPTALQKQSSTESTSSDEETPKPEELTTPLVPKRESPSKDKVMAPSAEAAAAKEEVESVEPKTNGDGDRDGDGDKDREVVAASSETGN